MDSNGRRTAARGTILVVDDNALLRRITRVLLERAGFAVIEAADGETALALAGCARQALALVLLDLAMPGIGGSEVLVRLRATQPGLPVVIMTGYSEAEARERFGAYVAAGFLAKPFQPDALLRTVRHALRLAVPPGV